MTVSALLAFLTALYLLLGSWSRREGQHLGIDAGAIIAADDAQLGMRTLCSQRFGLVGRPDQLLRVGRAVVPVEQKPHARAMQPSHVLQIAAQCLLVQEVYRVRPPYGLLVLAGGVQQQVPFTAQLETRLLDTMARMRQVLVTDQEPGPRWVGAKCRACRFRRTCWAQTLR
jgi:CRISPR-associated exonuclease Cas4